MRNISNFLTYLFHPLILTTYVSLFMLVACPQIFSSQEIDFKNFMLRVFINTFLFPAIVIVIMKQLRLINSFEMIDRKDRTGPMVVVLFFYINAIVTFFRQGETPLQFNVVILAILIALIAAFIINVVVMKIS